MNILQYTTLSNGRDYVLRTRKFDLQTGGHDPEDCDMRLTWAEFIVITHGGKTTQRLRVFPRDQETCLARGTEGRWDGWVAGFLGDWRRWWSGVGTLACAQDNAAAQAEVLTMLRRVPGGPGR